MVMGFLRVPTLAGKSTRSCGDLASVVFSTALYTFLWRC